VRIVKYDDTFAECKPDITKHFWTFKHFGNFVQPGTQRLPIEGDDATNNVMAVQSDDSYYILAMNPNSAETTISVSFPETVCATDAFRTSEAEDFASIDAAAADGDAWSLPLGSTSLTTYVFARGAC
jgi:hypothetical protein